MQSTEIEPALGLELRIEPSPDAIVLYCGGEITSGETTSAFRSAVVDLLHRHQNVIVDLGKVHCMDRSGLEALVSLYSSARTAKTKIKFENLMVEVSDSPPRAIQPHK